MEYKDIVENVRKFLRETYNPFIKDGYIDRLVLTERRELLQNLPGVSKEQLDLALRRMNEEGYIEEDNEILITFKLSFIL